MTQPHRVKTSQVKADSGIGVLAQDISRKMYESMYKQPDELVLVAHRTDQMETSRSSNLGANEKNTWTC